MSSANRPFRICNPPCCAALSLKACRELHALGAQSWQIHYVTCVLLEASGQTRSTPATAKPDHLQQGAFNWSIAVGRRVLARTYQETLPALADRSKQLSAFCVLRSNSPTDDDLPRLHAPLRQAYFQASCHWTCGSFQIPFALQTAPMLSTGGPHVQVVEHKTGARCEDQHHGRTGIPVTKEKAHISGALF